MVDRVLRGTRRVCVRLYAFRLLVRNRATSWLDRSFQALARV